MRLSFLQPITFFLAFLGALIFNAWIFHSVPLGLVLLACTLVGITLLLPASSKLSSKQTLWYSLSIIMILGSSAFYLHSLPAWFCFLIAGTGIALVGKRLMNTTWPSFQSATSLFTKPNRPGLFLLSLLTITVITLLYTIAQGATTEAIRSVWLVLDKRVFALFFIASLLTITLVFHRGTASWQKTTGLSLLLLPFLSVALLVFPLGYGFDPFIHQSTEQYIAQNGTITPKPLYYIGQYSIVVFLHHIFSLPVNLIDTWLVPILTCLLLTTSMSSFLKHAFPNAKSHPGLLFCLFLPLASFLMTTPQNLANLWTLLLCLQLAEQAITTPLHSTTKETLKIFAPSLLPALATLTIHPLAGIPALLLAIFVIVPRLSFVTHLSTLKRRLIIAIITTLSSILFPALFFAMSKLSGNTVTFQFANLLSPEKWSAIFPTIFHWQSQFNPLLDSVMLWTIVAPLAFLILTMIGTVSCWKQQKTLTRSLLLFVLVLGINYLLLLLVLDFSFLISYERNNYTERLIPLMVFGLTPLFLIGANWFGNRVLLVSGFRGGASAVFGGAFGFSFFGFSGGASAGFLNPAYVVTLALAITSAWYTTYPRHDGYAVSRGFNVSTYDLQTVNAIDDEAGDTPYIVLANQAVSSAAMSHIGFRYFDDQFFYPIPTGSPLYQIFLKMNETPSRDLVTQARALVNDKPQTVFYVVNDYWWDAPRLVEFGKQTADHWFAVGDSKVHVFEYRF